MSGDHNEHQKPYSYLDFECPRCGHCCKTDLARVGEVGVWGDVEPVAWTAMAFARLGEVRDKMRPDDVRIVQQFLDGDYTALEQTLEEKQEPVAWMHNFITGNVITHIPADIGRHPERWTPLYTAPCQTCQSLAMAVMNDQTYHEKVTPKQWVGLTDEEVSYCRYAATFCDELDTAYMAELIEKDLKEKNHG
jgi:hypothetical protein